MYRSSCSHIMPARGREFRSIWFAIALLLALGQWSPAFATDRSDNHAPTGLPVISGTAQLGESVVVPSLIGVAWVGQTLTASVSGIADEDGLTSAVYAYQWISIDGSTDTDIDGATAATYTLTDAEKFKKVKVRVTFTDDGGTEETLVSEPTSTIFAGSANPPSVRVECVDMVANPYGPLQSDTHALWWELHFSAPVDSITTNEILEGLETISQDGTELLGFWAGGGADWLASPYNRVSRYGFAPDESASDFNGVVVTVPAGRWRDRQGRPNTASSNALYLAHNWEVSVADATAEEGTDQTIDFEVTLNARDDCETVTVDWATEDGTAIAGPGGTTPGEYPGGTTPGDYTASNGTLTFSPGQTTKTISVAVIDDLVEDSGETFTLRLSNASGATIADAEATGTIFNEESPFASVPEIAGVAQVGNTLGVSFTEAPSGTLTYQWLRGSDAISGATASTYAPTEADVGARVSVQVRSGTESITSEATAPVWAPPANPPLADGEEEILSTTITLGWHEFTIRGTPIGPQGTAGCWASRSATWTSERSRRAIRAIRSMRSL